MRLDGLAQMPGRQDEAANPLRSQVQNDPLEKRASFNESHRFRPTRQHPPQADTIAARQNHRDDRLSCHGTQPSIRYTFAYRVFRSIV